ncbi:tuftelin [Neopelma chrysocephalum]|uniref:tuftelin n=1 Tax=Neopelma chrysocephalum TaxID=114329 RepID=UPI000FCD18C1|nr:tuftelin [Neopelma chrysocephalum]
MGPIPPFGSAVDDDDDDEDDDDAAQGKKNSCEDMKEEGGVGTSKNPPGTPWGTSWGPPRTLFVFRRVSGWACPRIGGRAVGRARADLGGAMNGLKGWCAVLDVRPQGESPESVKVLRLTLPHELPGERREQPKQKPVGKAFAMVANRSSNGHSLASECVKSNEGDEEIIKVYLKARGEGGTNHEEKVTQLKSEVRHIQEARSALKKLREDLSNNLENRQGAQEIPQVELEQHNGSWSCPERLQGESLEEQEEENCSSQDVETLQQTARRLLRRLQEAEKRHQLERKAFERTVAQYQEEAERASSALRRAERDAEQRELRVDELQRLLAGMEKERRGLVAQLRDGEAELERLRSVEGDKLAQQDRVAQLEKEVATLREKIHHLDDMLKSQQRKVRQMIEQLQNSKTVIQAKDSTIQELKERVSYLEAENLEMHDRIEHLIEKQVSRGGLSSRARSKSEYVSSKRLTGPKPLPLIRVVET